MGFSWILKDPYKPTFDVNPADLHVSVALKDASGSCPSPEYFVFYNNLKTPEGSVSLIGPTKGDDKLALRINLDSVPANITSLSVIVAVSPPSKGPTLKGTKQVNLRILDDAGNETHQCTLNPDDIGYSESCEFIQLSRDATGWKVFPAMDPLLEFPGVASRLAGLDAARLRKLAGPVA